MTNCKRCKEKGATARCFKCHSWYHGYRCAKLQMVEDIKYGFKCLKCHLEQLKSDFDNVKKPDLLELPQ